VEVIQNQYGVSLKRVTSAEKLHKYLHRLQYLGGTSDIVRIITHVSDNLFIETIHAIRSHLKTQFPLLIVSGDDFVFEGVYNYPRVKAVSELTEIVQYCSLKYLSWIPDLSNGPMMMPNSKEIVGRLNIVNMKCTNLQPKDPNGKSDPYVLIRMDDGQKFRSKTIKETLNPDWSDYEIDWMINCKSSSNIVCQVWDWDLVGEDDFEGQIILNIEEILQEMSKESPSLEKTYQLIPEGEEPVKPKNVIKKTWRKSAQIFNRFFKNGEENNLKFGTEGKKKSKE